MMRLFDEKYQQKLYWEGEIEDAAEKATMVAERAAAERMIKNGKLSLDEIALYVPSLSFDELKGIKAEIGL